MSWACDLTEDAETDLRGLPKAIQKRVARVLEQMAMNPLEDHFVLRGAVIEPLTTEGKATGRLLKLNLDKRVVERHLLAAVGATNADEGLRESVAPNCGT